MKMATLKNWIVPAQIGGVTAFYGVIVAVGMIASFGNLILTDIPALLFLVVAAIGAGIAGLVLAPCFGRLGWSGHGLALVGGIIATFLGAFIAGMMALPFDLWLLSSVAVMFMFASPALIFWGFGLVLLQWSARGIRQRNVRKSKLDAPI